MKAYSGATFTAFMILFLLVCPARGDWQQDHAAAMSALDLGKVDKALQLEQRGMLDQSQTRGRHAAHAEFLVALAESGRLETALEMLDLAADAWPDAAVVYHTATGWLLQEEGRWKEAEDAYRLAMADAPKAHLPQAALAWLLATCPDDSIRNGQEALALADRSMALSHEGNDMLLSMQALAAASAEVANYAQAVEVQKGLVTIMEMEGVDQDELAAQKEILLLYQQGKPWRMPVPKAR